MPSDRLITVSYTALDAGGGVPKFNRDLHAAFPDRECLHFSMEDLRTNQVVAAEWEKARILNQYLISRRLIRRDDVIVADGFWAMGLEHLPFAVSHSHGIWGHITHDDVLAGKQPENQGLHAAQVTFRRRWTKLGKPFTAVSDFIAEQMRLQWGFMVDRVIDNGVDTDVYRPLMDWGRSGRPIVVHGVNDPGNVNKGWDHIELLKRELDADVLSLDELAAKLGDDKPTALATADLLVHPSGYEGNSMLVAEALACAVPIVGYNVGFAWRLWRDAGGPCLTVGEILDRRERSPQNTLDACRRVLGRLGQENLLSSGPNMGAAAYMTAHAHLSIRRFRDSWREYVASVEARV